MTEQYSITQLVISKAKAIGIEVVELNEPPVLCTKVIEFDPSITPNDPDAFPDETEPSKYIQPGNLKSCMTRAKCNTPQETAGEIVRGMAELRSSKMMFNCQIAEDGSVFGTYAPFVEAHSDSKEEEAK